MNLEDHRGSKLVGASSAFRLGNTYILPLVGAASLLGGCVSNSYMGIPLIETAADPALRSLAQRAATGDKRAQLELGIRFEEGRGVPVDRKRAKKLYQLAANDSGGTTWIYRPSVRNGANGGVFPVDRGAKQAGLEEARMRLDLLND